MSPDEVVNTLALLDWRRRIAELYAAVRAAEDSHAAWSRWRQTRGRLFRTHGQSPLPASERAGYTGPYMFDYDPGWRALAQVRRARPERLELPTSDADVMTVTRFARAQFEVAQSDLELDLYLLHGYGGGLFVPFADTTSGSETYGAGRYLLDTIKGADLGTEGDRLVLDFNFAYPPSCSYDPRWTCPLAPPANRLALPIRAGERLAPGDAAPPRTGT